MGQVRIFEAAAEGFRLIRREPKTVLAWSLVSYLIMGAPMILMMNRMAVATDRLDRGAAAGDPTASFAGLVALMPVAWLGLLLGYVLIGGGVLRAVLAPQDRRFFFLRLGKAELWLALSAVVAGVLVYIAFFVVFMLLMFMVLMPIMLGLPHPEGGASWLFFGLPLLLMLSVYLGGICLALRFSMGPIMSFDQKQFRLFESWSLTKGSGWRLVGLWLLLSLLIVVVEVVLLGAIVLVGGPNVFAMFADPVGAQLLAEGLWDFYASPWIWGVSMVGAIFSGPFLAILIAPWARAYQMLRDAPPVEPAAV